MHSDSSNTEIIGNEILGHTGFPLMPFSFVVHFLNDNIRNNYLEKGGKLCPANYLTIMNKVLLKQNHSHSVTYYLWLIVCLKWQNRMWPIKFKVFNYLTLYRNFLPNFGLEDVEILPF